MFNYFMNEALLLAHRAKAEGEIPVGAVIVKDNKIIASAYNKKEQTHNAAAHAEILAIAKAGQALGKWQLDGCDLYVTLQPCDMCRFAIAQARLKSVYFGAFDPKIEFVMENTAVYGGIMEQECKKMIDDFFKDARSFIKSNERQ